MDVYRVRVSAIYHVSAKSRGDARFKALETMRWELVQCPENLGDFDTDVSLLSSSEK